MVQKRFLSNTREMATNSAHGVAYHRGLGTPLFPSSSVPTTKYLDADTIEAFSYAAYAKPNIALVANGADSAELQKWVGEYFADARASAPSGMPALSAPQAKYYGGEERIAHAGGNTVTITGPGKQVAGAAAKAVESIKAVAGGKIAKEDFQKAVAQAKFKELEFGQNIWAGIELTGSGLISGGKAYQLDETAKAIGAVTEDQLKKVSELCTIPSSWKLY